jgi:hypothetical protein
MPLTDKGRKIKAAMTQSYGEEKGERVFHASANKGTITGVHREGRRRPLRSRMTGTSAGY